MKTLSATIAEEARTYKTAEGYITDKLQKQLRQSNTVNEKIRELMKKLDIKKDNSYIINEIKRLIAKRDRLPKYSKQVLLDIYNRANINTKN